MRVRAFQSSDRRSRIRIVNQNRAISPALSPQAQSEANSMDPEHAQIAHRSTPASSNARRTPHRDAVAPLPPDARIAMRLPASSGTEIGRDAGNSGARGGAGCLARARGLRARISVRASDKSFPQSHPSGQNKQFC
jgi:hypothetical protein